MNDEWYTPAQYVELARTVLGYFDLDPASNPIAQRTVKARSFFTANDNGLSRHWHGKVWMNPPYSRGLMKSFCTKLAEEYGSGRVSEAIVLTHNNTDTGWFHLLAQRAAVICFTRGRIRFVSPNKKANSPEKGQSFFYFGDNGQRFSSVFGQVGLVCTPAAFAAANDNFPPAQLRAA